MKSFIMFVMLLLFAHICYACYFEEGSYSGTDCGEMKFSAGAYSDMTAAEWQDARINLASMPTSDIRSNTNAIENANRIGELTPEQIAENTDRLTETGIRQLTVNQLTYTGSDSKTTIDKIDANLLPEDVKNQALTILGKGDPIQAQTNQPTHITTLDDGFSIENANTFSTPKMKATNIEGLTFRANNYEIQSADSIQITSSTPQGPTTTTIVSGKNIKYNNGKITVEQASLILEDFAITNEPRKYVTDFNEFTTETAEMVYYRGIMVYDVVNTTFRIGDDKIVMIPLNKNVIHINDTNENNIHFKPINDITKVEEELGIQAKDITPEIITLLPEDIRKQITQIATIRPAKNKEIIIIPKQANITRIAEALRSTTTERITTTTEETKGTDIQTSQKYWSDIITLSGKRDD